MGRMKPKQTGLKRSLMDVNLLFYCAWAFLFFSQYGSGLDAGGGLEYDRQTCCWQSTRAHVVLSRDRLQTSWPSFQEQTQQQHQTPNVWVSHQRLKGTVWRQTQYSAPSSLSPSTPDDHCGAHQLTSRVLALLTTLSGPSNCDGPVMCIKYPFS